MRTVYLLRITNSLDLDMNLSVELKSNADFAFGSSRSRLISLCVEQNLFSEQREINPQDRNASSVVGMDLNGNYVLLRLSGIIDMDSTESVSLKIIISDWLCRSSSVALKACSSSRFSGAPGF